MFDHPDLSSPDPDPCDAGLSPDCTGEGVRLVEAPGSNAAGLLLVCDPCSSRVELTAAAYQRATAGIRA